jgi:hypothetical protein
MRLIQDIFRESHTEAIRLATKLVDTAGVPTGVELSSLLYYCSTPTEFVNEVETKLKKSDVYPFIFMESGDNIEYGPILSDGWQPVLIKQTFLCTLNSPDYTAEQRDIESFKPILFPLKEAFEKSEIECPIDLDTFEIYLL